MIYFYTQGMNDLIAEYCDSENSEKFNDIYNNVVEKFYAEHDLPALHLWESGFCKGDASVEELKKLANKGLIEYVDEDGYDFTRLDKLLLSDLENAAK